MKKTSVAAIALVALGLAGGMAKAVHFPTSGPAAAFVKSFTVTPPAVRPGAQTIVRVSAGAEDDGAVTYAWQADAGTLSARDTNPVTWTLPEAEGTYLVTVEATNADGIKSRGSASILVTRYPADPLIISVSPAGYKRRNPDLAVRTAHTVSGSR